MAMVTGLRSFARWAVAAAPLVAAAADPTAAMFDPARVIVVDIRLPDIDC